MRKEDMTEAKMTRAEVLALALARTQLDWHHFEADRKGEICVGWAEPEPGCALFKMRVGTYLGKPMQTIIADGTFIKFREAPQYKEYILHKLDPHHPDQCTYAAGISLSAYDNEWCPRVAAYLMQQQQAAMQAQAQKMLANQYAPPSYGVASTTGLVQPMLNTSNLPTPGWTGLARNLMTIKTTP